MSARKFVRPRHGNLAFVPRRRARGPQGRIRSFPRDDKSQAPHLTAFACFKAGVTHICRDLDRPGSKMHKKEIIEAVTVMDSPPMIAVGFVGYNPSPTGRKCFDSIFAQHLPESLRRRYVKRWFESHKKPFTKYAKKFANRGQRAKIEKRIRKIKKMCSTIRLLAITQPYLTMAKQKKSHLLEIQINGGTTSDKVDFALKLFEQEIPITSIFEESEMVDMIGVTKGHGFQGVIKRFGVTRLPRKTHRGLRKVACIGAWHPPRVSWTIARAGQFGFHHRTMMNMKIYKIGKSMKEDKGNARCETDLTDKTITPMGGFPHYGIVRNDYLLIKGAVTGSRKRLITLRKLIRPNATRAAQEKITLKFIDTSSKYGHGKFQTSEEKEKFLGPRKKRRLA